MALKRPENWENVKAVSERENLPVGAYVCKIVTAGVRTYKKSDGSGSFDRLEVAFDIQEGDFAGHYQKDFDSQRNEDKKWKGVLRLYIPVDDGSEKDEWTKRIFKGFTDSLEASNLGYHWDWEEKSLKGKMVGILFRNEQWAMGERSGWKAQPFRALAVDAVRGGKFTIPKARPNKNAVSIDVTADGDNFAVVDDTEDLPF